MTHTVESLVAFEEKVAQAFRDKRIRAPIHLCSPGQAEPLLEIFEHIKESDWVFGTWRGHWAALLKGVPEEEVFQAILDGRSMFLQFAKQRVLCSAIVGGILPIALGVAAGVKRTGGDERVYVFLGDMAARSGLFFEFVQYWKGHELPIHVTIENNGVSTNTPTEKVWGCPAMELCRHGITEYEYERTWPHTGVGSHVQF